MYSTLQKRKIHVGSELDLKYDVCLIMPLYYHTEIEAKSEKELWEQIDELKHDYQKLSDICIGKGNPAWNCSAPHGAGRKMSRAKAKENIDYDVFKESMNGIYTSSVCRSTLDESPQAYKDASEIERLIAPTVEVVEHLKPLYNFKAH